MLTEAGQGRACFRPLITVITIVGTFSIFFHFCPITLSNWQHTEENVRVNLDNTSTREEEVFINGQTNISSPIEEKHRACKSLVDWQWRYQGFRTSEWVSALLPSLLIKIYVFMALVKRDQAVSQASQAMRIMINWYLSVVSAIQALRQAMPQVIWKNNHSEYLRASDPTRVSATTKSVWTRT